MNASAPRQPSGRSGFTLVEVVISAFLIGGLVAIAFATYLSVVRDAREGAFQLSLLAKAHAAEQTILRYVQAGQAVGVRTNMPALTILAADMTESEIRFADGDADPDTVGDNVIEYDPDTGVAGDERVLCELVSEIPGEAMFRIVPTFPATAVITFHVGEIPLVSDSLLTGQGYQGLQVRLSATPRRAG